MRKALQTEQGKGDMEGRIGTLEAETKDFERQVTYSPSSLQMPDLLVGTLQCDAWDKLG